MKVQVNEADVPDSLRRLAQAVNTLLERGEVVSTERTAKLPTSTSTNLPLRYNKDTSKLELFDTGTETWKGVTLS